MRSVERGTTIRRDKARTFCLCIIPNSHNAHASFAGPSSPLAHLSLSGWLISSRPFYMHGDEYDDET